MRTLMRFTLALVPLLLLLGSCGDRTPIEPTPQLQFTASAEKLGQLARYSTGAPTLTIAFAKKFIGPQGGQLSLGDFEVIVPAGAVDKWTLFTIKLPVDLTTSEYVRAEFLPHQDFAVPVTIRLPLKGTTAEEDGDTHILWWNGSNWDAFPSVKTSDGRLETQTWHFSEYGTEDTDPSKGIILVGGGK